MDCVVEGLRVIREDLHVFCEQLDGLSLRHVASDIITQYRALSQPFLALFSVTFYRSNLQDSTEGD